MDLFPEEQAPAAVPANAPSPSASARGHSVNTGVSATFVAEGKLLRRAVEGGQDHVAHPLRTARHGKDGPCPDHRGQDPIPFRVAQRRHGRTGRPQEGDPGGKGEEEAGVRTILFLDEIHRFNKLQQDALLPDVEEGNITLIAATVENPFFTVNAALLSRSHVFELKPLDEQDILAILRDALADRERGLGHLPVEATDEALKHIAVKADGDARKALSALEVAALTTSPGEDGRIVITLDIAEESIQKKAIVYDQEGGPALRHDLRLHQEHARVRSRCSRLLPGEDALRGGGPAFYRAPDRHLRVRGCGQRRSHGTRRCHVCTAGGRVHRHARGAHPPCPGDDLHCDSGQKQCLLPRHRGRHGRCRDGADHGGARSPQGQSLPGGEEARPREGLQVSPRFRRSRRAGIPAGEEEVLLTLKINRLAGDNPFRDDRALLITGSVSGKADMGQSLSNAMLRTMLADAPKSGAKRLKASLIASMIIYYWI
ncbi:MAG: hypothetical protein MZV70_00460 [Desulfobacterales bacterium]|nr:hypothetical protein [Desulfobacterales bacterium]